MAYIRSVLMSGREVWINTAHIRAVYADDKTDNRLRTIVTTGDNEDSDINIAESAPDFITRLQLLESR